jgi:hypothetical protein
MGHLDMVIPINHIFRIPMRILVCKPPIRRLIIPISQIIRLGISIPIFAAKSVWINIEKFAAFLIPEGVIIIPSTS